MSKTLGNPLETPQTRGRRSLSWGGASPSLEKLEMRAQRIFGAKLGELQDPLMDIDDAEIRTALQNALAVGLHPSPATS